MLIEAEGALSMGAPHQQVEGGGPQVLEVLAAKGCPRVEQQYVELGEVDCYAGWNWSLNDWRKGPWRLGCHQPPPHPPL